eukprot:scaffold26962_cov48-Attheya_sp.AAC.6
MTMLGGRQRSSVALAVATATSGALLFALHSIHARRRRNRKQFIKNNDGGAYEALVGNTPLVKLEKLSVVVGRSIYVKMESSNPGGTGKDRAALYMLRYAETHDQLPLPLGTTSASHSQRVAASNDAGDAGAPHEYQGDEQWKELIEEAIDRSKTGGVVVEGTSGSTGISLASLCAARGHACVVCMPDDQSSQKVELLRHLGALVHVVPTAAISNPNHYVNIARRLAIQINNIASSSTNERVAVKALFVDQFENMANTLAHYETTGPEIWNGMKQQYDSLVDAFVMSSGTGGTIAGVGKYLKELNLMAQIVLVDPPGSALYNKVLFGVAYASQQRERALKRHRYDTIAEGIGLDRVTQNFAGATIDHAIQVSDQEALDMAHWLLREEGLFVGSSSAMNVVGAVRHAQTMPKNSNIVTVICDGGQRHLTRFWNKSYLTSSDWNLTWPTKDTVPDCLQPHSST